MSIESPVNSIPPVIVAVFLVIAAVEVVVSLGATSLVGGQTGIGWRVQALQGYAFAPGIWDAVTVSGQWTFDLLKRFVTYAFVHRGFTDAVFGAALLLALGKFVGDIFHWASVVLILLVSTVFGAVCFGILAPGNTPLIGAFPPVYGLIGAFTYIMWLRLGQMGQNQLAAFRLIGFLLAIQLGFGLLFGGNSMWIADIAGFVAGLCLAPLVAPGGLQAFLARMRQR